MKKLLFAISFITLCATQLVAQPTMKNQRLDSGWEFIRTDLGSIWEAVREAKPGQPETVPLWQKVDLPHCFNATDAVAPDVNYYQGPGWYRKNITIDNPYKDGRTMLHFEGVGQKTRLYVYTTLVGEHVGGYDEFSFDITDAAKAFLSSPDAARFGGKVPISIRVDNSRDNQMIPSDMSDFNVYGGIYRHLNLVYTPALAINKFQIDASVDAAGKEGNLAISFDFANFSKVDKAKVTITIVDAMNRQVIYQMQYDDLSAIKKTINETIKKPAIWSPDKPNLYTAYITLSSSAGDMTMSDSFGFRNYEFTEKGPFMLNGERLLLRGVHRHEDHAGVGAAMSDEMIRAEMQMIKDMGANFIRLGHYQQSRLVLKLCDELGIMVWEEIPWCRGGLGGPVYQEQAKRMLTNMISQHRNHPSIILWGMGNENDWPNDFPEFDKEKIRTFMKELNDLSHQLDNSRKTSIRRCSFCSDIVDVYSPSIWAGWYKGAYVDYKNASRAEMLGVNRFIHVEWGADSHAGRNAEDTHIGITYAKEPSNAEIIPGKPQFTEGKNNSNTGEWSETYACELIDWTLNEQLSMPWLTGAAYWSFKDFSTPLRPENPVPYVNQKGLVERDLTPKESYYVFQSYWTKKPMVHIYGHSWPVRWGESNEVKQLLVYSNCDEVELFLNGKSLGTKKRVAGDFPASGLRWDTPLADGANHIKAIAKQGKVSMEDEITFDYQTVKWGVPTHISVEITPAEKGYVWVEAQLLDNKWVRCLDSRNYIDFSITGDGELIQDQGTSSGSRIVQAYNGHARIKVRVNDGNSMVGVKSTGAETQFIEVKKSFRPF